MSHTNQRIPPPNKMNFQSVPAQTDTEYSSVSSNQCSWCAAEFALKRTAIIQAWMSKNTQEFLHLYNSCMKTASQKRKDLGTFLYGENIDSENLLNHYGKQLDIVHKYTLKLHTDTTFPEILHPDLRAEFYTRDYVDYISLESILHDMPFKSYLLVSRHGQSLCVIRVHSNSYLILDSHLHIASMATKEETMKHILMDNGGHTHVTLLFGV